MPARYVSGYFIRPAAFNLEYDKDGRQKYVADVTDYNAHPPINVSENSWSFVRPSGTLRYSLYTNLVYSSWSSIP